MTTLQKMLQKAGLEPYSYSGRGMYDDECLAVVVDDLGQFLSRICKAMLLADVTQADAQRLADDLAGAYTDAMGFRGMVIYWRHLDYEPAEAAQSDTITSTST